MLFVNRFDLVMWIVCCSPTLVVADEEAKQSRTVHAYGWPAGATKDTVRAMFPTAQEVTVVPDKEEWYLAKASMVFPTVKAAREAAGSGERGDGQSLALEFAGAAQESSFDTRVTC